jgi:hypothetical protein
LLKKLLHELMPLATTKRHDFQGTLAKQEFGLMEKNALLPEAKRT